MNSSSFLEHGSPASCEINRKQKRGQGLEVLCGYHFVAKQRLAKKLMSLPQFWDVSLSCPI